jgi:predicted RNase H-like nuclease (RuvC/YqgF family)
MRKTISALAVTIFIAGAILTGCQSSAKKVENARDKVIEANQELSQALKDSIQQFKTESELKISANEKSIAEFKAKIKNEKKENKAAYEKKLAELEQKNSDLKKKLEEFKDDSKANWKTFKTEFSNDMNELGQALKDFTVKNVK